MDGKLFHPDSCPCSRDELNLFDVPMTQTSITRSRYVKYHPVNSLEGEGPLEFQVVSGKDEYLDLFNSILFIECSIVAEDGSRLPEAADGQPPDTKSICWPINYFHATQFKQVQVHLNGTLVSSSDNMYPYRAYLEALTSYSPAVKNNQLRAGLFYMDDENMHEHKNVSGDAEHNSGAFARYSITSSSQVFQTFGKIHNDLFNQRRFLLPFSHLSLRLIRNNYKFYMMAADPSMSYRVNYHKAILYVRQCDVEHEFSSNLLKQVSLKKDGAKYPVERVVAKFFTKGPNRNDLSVPNLIEGDFPKRIICGMVLSRGFNGDVEFNPLAFENFKVQNITLRRNGVAVPFETLRLDFSTGGNGYFEGYLAFLQGSGLLFSDQTNGIDPAAWKSGSTLFVFDLTADESFSTESVNLSNEGKVGLELTLADPSTQSITLVVLACYDDMITVDGTNQVKYARDK